MKKMLMAAFIVIALCSACKNDAIPDTSPSPNPTPAPGALVEGFGTSGVVTENPTSGLNSIRASTIAGEWLYLACRDWVGLSDYQWRIEKRSLSTGALDSAFGTGGVVASNPSATSDYPEGIACDGTFLYIVGYDSAAGGGEWRIEKRALSDGSLVPSFGAAGVMVSDPSDYWDTASCLAINGAYMYVGGIDESISSSDSMWRIEKRRLDTGALDTNFSSGGHLVSNGSVGFDMVSDIWTDGSSFFVAGGDPGGSGGQGRIEKYSTEYGEADDSFGASGRVLVDTSSRGDFIYGIAVDSQGLYCVISDGSPGSGDSQWLIQKRSLQNGGVIWSKAVNPSDGPDSPTHILLDGEFLYTVGIDCSGGNTKWRIEKRVKTDGEFSIAFGTGGVVLSDPSTDVDTPYSIVLDSEAIYVSGTDGIPGVSDSEMRVEKRYK